jgi:hypothetical protein
VVNCLRQPINGQQISSAKTGHDAVDEAIQRQHEILKNTSSFLVDKCRQCASLCGAKRCEGLCEGYGAVGACNKQPYASICDIFAAIGQWEVLMLLTVPHHNRNCCHCHFPGGRLQ